MDKIHILISLSLLAIAVALLVIDSYFSSLVLYFLGLFYIYQGWTEKESNSRSALGSLLVGVFITAITFFAKERFFELVRISLASIVNIIDPASS